MRGEEYLFLDGYNIINCWEDLKKLSVTDLESARNKLIDTMVEYHVYTKTIVVIVFDAHMVKNGSRKVEKVKGVEVVYTKEHETADSYIEKTLDKIGKIRRVRVATSDWIEQQVILGRGGTRISARELKLEIEDNKRHIEKKSRELNRPNDLVIGRLDESSLKKLSEWKRLNCKE
jgi:uncharacterized protein